MSQSATQESVSNATTAVNGDWTEVQFVASARRATERKATGVSREVFRLKRVDIIRAVRMDYVSHFPSVIAKKGDLLPAKVFAAIESAVDEVMANIQANLVNSENIISGRKFFYWDRQGSGGITERRTLTGEVTLSHREQLLGCDIYLRQAKERLVSLETATPAAEVEKIKDCKARITELTLLRGELESEIERQDALIREAKKNKPTAKKNKPTAK